MYQKISFSYLKFLLPTICLVVILWLIATSTDLKEEGNSTIPPDFSIAVLSGSYAPWGISQSLYIDSLGNVAFYQSSLDTAIVDSIFALLTSQQMQEIYDTVNAVGFFSLDTLYESGALDGSGIRLWITASGTRHSVEDINLSVLEVNRVIWTLNRILVPFGIELSYGAVSDTLTGKEEQ